MSWCMILLYCPLYIQKVLSNSFLSKYSPDQGSVHRSIILTNVPDASTQGYKPHQRCSKSRITKQLAYYLFLWCVTFLVHFCISMTCLIFTVFTSDLKEIGGSGDTTCTTTSNLSTHQQGVCWSGENNIWKSVWTKGHRKTPQNVSLFILVFIIVGFHFTFIRWNIYTVHNTW